MHWAIRNTDDRDLNGSSQLEMKKYDSFSPSLDKDEAENRERNAALTVAPHWCYTIRNEHVVYNILKYILSNHFYVNNIIYYQ